MDRGFNRTLSLHTGTDPRKLVSLVPHLFLVVQARSGGEAPLRMRLNDLDEVALSRGDRRHIGVVSNGVTRRLCVEIADDWMSANHAGVIREGSVWRLVDRGSKNGTKVNGQRERSVVLCDGDWLEVGRTFLLYRERLASVAEAPQWFDARDLDAPAGLATMSPELAERFDELARLAASKAPVVLRGATGSGKELLARAMHTLSRRRGRFIAVNCAGLPETLLESELFGYVKGAFSGATSDREGLVAASDGGTLFLDEIGDLPGFAQAKLLRALQEQAVRPVGGTAEVRVDLRVICATHRNLEELAKNGEFRDDLLGRLGSSFELPPLSERREDLGLILDAVLRGIADPRARTAELSSAVIRRFLNYAWPRNVRELQKVLERAIALAKSGPVGLGHLPPELLAQTPGTALPKEYVELSVDEQAERCRLSELLRVHRGNIAAVARDMQMVRSQVQSRMKRYGIDRESALRSGGPAIERDDQP